MRLERTTNCSMVHFAGTTNAMNCTMKVSISWLMTVLAVALSQIILPRVMRRKTQNM